MSIPQIDCKLVTDECVREWKNGNSTFRVPDPVSMLRFLYELCSTLVRGDLPFQKCKMALDSVEFLDKPSVKEVASSFADIVTQMAQDMTMLGEYRARLIKLAKWLVESALVPMRLFQERCEEEFLWEAEMTKIKAPDLKGKEVRVNTRLLYQQTKFNLLREESEGYAKLVTLLCRGSEDSGQSVSAATIGIIKFLEDEIFSEPTLTGMSAELMSLHCEPHDLSRIRVSENDESHGSSEVHINEGSSRPNVTEGGMEGSSDVAVLRNDVEAQPADNTIQIESQQGGDHQLGSHYLDSHGHNAITDMNDLKTMQCEPLTEMDIDRGHTDVDDAANCFMAQGMPTDEKTDSADVFLQIDASCLSPEQKVDAQPVEENASLLDVINSKGVDAAQVADENADDVVAVETETKERDELPSQEGKVGISVENGADILTDCTAFTENVNTLEPASLENDVCNNLVSANDDPSKPGVVNEDGDLVADFVSDGKDLVSNHMSGEEPIIDLVEHDADLKNAGLETGENSIFQEVDLQNVMDVEIAALDHRAVEDHGEYEGFGMGNDTDFLNVDDDEVAEDYDDDMEHTEDARLLENSGWSSRTRAVAKYLQTLFNREATNGRKVLAMDHLLAGKTRKEASRMFFETLVLKSKDYIHVEQARSLDNINIKPSAKLIKSEF
ncbi:hypothetical protein Q3G72_018316 [Acer saccharum]|nr:hypothetical protein Q3G72_018316 [Acer saccharum]